MPDSAEVTAAEIARLAGVGRAAVSNWRRRHADFPRPSGGTETSPTFTLGAVEEWLRGQGKLAEVPLPERVWRQIDGDTAGAADALARAGSFLLTLAAGGDPGPGATDGPVPGLVAELAAELGAREAYEFLLGRYLDANSRQLTLTPPPLSELMAALAGPAGTPEAPGAVLDPACGAGGLLRAAVEAHPSTSRPASDSDPDSDSAFVRVHGQETDPALARLAGLRLALCGARPVQTSAGDALRADAFPELAADVVLCHPPFNERNWGHDELAYDPRWEYGLPARTESELAWVQHALARTATGGTAVVLMPPAAASRRSGRRVRADLLRRGALRAVIALPAGVAPPYGVALQVWVLRKPGPGAGAGPTPSVLLMDAGAGASGRGGAGRDRERIGWEELSRAVLDAWRAFRQADDTGVKRGERVEEAGVYRAVPVIDLLDDEVDLSPARQLPPPVAADSAHELAETRARLDALLGGLALLDRALPDAERTADGDGGRWPVTTVGELARAGALVLHTQSGTVPTGDDVPVLTEQDVAAGSPPGAGTTAQAAGELVTVRTGDVVLPVLGRGAVARVVEEGSPAAGAVLGRNLYLLRPDPAALDPWFVAGFLRGTANSRRASSYASSVSRLDVRRLRVPRLPLNEQRRYGTAFRELAVFEDALRAAGELGARLAQGLGDGFCDGSLRPRDTAAER